MDKKRVLIVYYSFSGQTQLLIQRIAFGLRESGVEAVTERLQPVEPISFPFLSWAQMAKVMIFSFFRWRVPVKQPADILDKNWDYVILAGPTWSYNPSGPVLDFLDKYGQQTLSGAVVIPFISCRSYWWTHYIGLKGILRKMGATVQKPLVFRHCSSEPWRTIGLLLQLMGKLPRREVSWFRKKYPRYGHSQEQCTDALELGKMLAERVRGGDQG